MKVRKFFLILFLWAVTLLVSSNIYAEQVVVTFSGKIDKVYAGHYNVGDNISGKIIYNSSTKNSSFPTGSPPYDINFNGAINTFTLNDLFVDKISFNMINQTCNGNECFNGGKNIYYYLDFEVSGFDKNINNTIESMNILLKGYDIIDNIFYLIKNVSLSDLDYSRFNYTLQNLNDNSFYKRFSGKITQLDFSIIKSPLISPSLSLILEN